MTTTTRARRPSAPRTTAQQGPAHLRLVRCQDPGAVGAPRGAAFPEPPLRLTRRGRALLRALVVLGLAGLMTAAALLMAHRADAADGPVAKAVVKHHVVLPGETLWGIATGLAPRADPRDTVATIVEFNALPSSAVRAGQDLAIPPGLSPG